LDFVAVVGCLTLTLMALIAIVQTDIKKCLAYSTLSQLGYMIFGMGVGAWIAALFHLITHAFFKAMLFLGSGQVIEGCHHEQDMRKMGGLRHKMPVTCWTFFVGVLAISGAGIAGTHFGLGGFFSKDEILAVAYARAFEWDDYHKHVAGEHHAGGIENGESRMANGRPTSHAERSEASPGRRLSEADILRSAQNDPGRTRSFYRVTDQLNRQSTIDNRQLLLARSSDQPEPQPHGGAALGHATQPDQSHDGASPTHATQGHESGGQEGAAHEGRQTIFAGMRPLPKWLFYCALLTAYVTPFYMMRAWWMTFMGKPRDHHVHEHAHENWLMYVPLAVLAVGTFFASYFLFRPMIADAAPIATAAAMVLPTDGALHTPAIGSAHHWLTLGVGFAFLVGFGVAIAIYKSGLDVADRIKNANGVTRGLYTILEHKYYFDEVYDIIWVQGTLLLARICRFIDTWIVDLVFNLAASATERLAAFSGWILDAHGVDGIFNGMAKTSVDFANAIRMPQTGRIRNYVLISAGVATAILLAMVIVYSQPEKAAAVAAG
jgi:NADH:ubiquinone oxidoreductase subunit 5 (subunit L)/multisubunit Na+/H+ antiporter MnhA subunit